MIKKSPQRYAIRLRFIDNHFIVYTMLQCFNFFFSLHTA